MKSAIRVSGVWRLMVSGFAAAVLFIGASTRPAQANNPSNATASSTVQWGVDATGSLGWKLGQVDRSDNGGNYTAALLNPPGIYCNVNQNGLVGPQSAKGTCTYTQHFMWTGDPNAIGDFSHHTTASSTAIFERINQTAHAKAHSVYIISNGVTAEVTSEATATAIDTPDGFAKVNGGIISHPDFTTCTETATTEADVSTP